MMASIARTTEREAPYARWNEHRVRRTGRDPGYTIAHSVVEAARELELDALVVPTLSGRSARLVSAHRPTMPIYALSPGKETVRRCGLMWGVRAASMRKHEVTEELIADAARRVVELGWCQPGPARRHHRRPAERPARHDEHVPGPAPGRSGPPARRRARAARRRRELTAASGVVAAPPPARRPARPPADAARSRSRSRRTSSSP